APAGCTLKCTGHQTVQHGKLSGTAGHVDRKSHNNICAAAAEAPARVAQTRSWRTPRREGIVKKDRRYRR
nr:hypothetical protein [Tanacetum cinerariifolium]